jgi:hypothetical protein
MDNNNGSNASGAIVAVVAVLAIVVIGAIAWRIFQMQSTTQDTNILPEVNIDTNSSGQ